MRRDGGFTLVELMFAVAILGILATIAVVAYTRNVRSARAGEVPEMFGLIKMQENVYRTEVGYYLPLCKVPSGAPYQDCAEGDYWPDPLPGKGGVMDATTMPARWVALKVKIPRSGLYCQYGVVGGKASDDTNIGAIGSEMFTGAPPRNWFYMIAQCDWDGDSSTKAQYWQRDDQTELGKLNEGQ